MPVKVLLKAAIAIGLLLPSPAVAQFVVEGIEIDGNYIDEPPPELDWFPDFPPRSDPFGSGDDSLCGTSPAPKNDITNYYLANNTDFLYVGMERLANTGQTSFFFHFDITGDGPSKGDFIFVFCFGSGTAVTDTFVLEWDETLGEFVQDATPPTVDFQVNTMRIPAPFLALDRKGRPQPFIDAGKFAEASIDLSSIEGFDICDAVEVTAEVQTKSSCSLRSQCKDTTGPFIFSFQQLEADLALEQEDECDPVITATANGMGPRMPLMYRWFLDGVELMDPALSGMDQIKIPIDPADCGDHEVEVIVGDGVCEVADAEVFDINVPPAAGFAATDVGDCDLTLTYDGSASTDCDGDPLTFSWDLDGDGGEDSTDPAGTFVYPGCGERTVSLVVSDGACESPQIEQAVYANEPPVAALRITPLDCLTVEFEDVTVDCDLGKVSTLYSESLTRAIDLGDGSPVTMDPLGLHTYPTCGIYKPFVVTTDAKGCEDRDEREIEFTTSVTVK